DNYYGRYLACLLETGELPTLGFEGAEGECNEEFLPFTFTAGRQPRNPPPEGTGLGNTSSSGGSQPLVTPKSEPGEGQPGGPQSVASSGGSEGGGGGSISAGPQLMGDSGRSRRVPLTGQERGDGSGRVAIANTIDQSGLPASARSAESGRPLLVPAPDDEDGGADVAGRKANVPAPQGEELEGQRIPAEAAKKKQQVQADEGWSLPDFFKFLLIAALIIIMLVFFGGQALQISKGREK
ncbi:MAG TPA: hypothetical protein VFV50_01230, partial [Bdellovibrionales bacterium]|nr:hypothetical protein [Bdellovibrionales bacterium]